jgi:hypothetical protein
MLAAYTHMHMYMPAVRASPAVLVTPSVLPRKTLTKSCLEHHVYVSMHVRRCKNKFLGIKMINANGK